MVDARFTFLNLRFNRTGRDWRRMDTAIAPSRESSQAKMPSLLSNRRGIPARLVFRLPLIVYRLGLGWMLGHQFLVLTHVGRRSARPFARLCSAQRPPHDFLEAATLVDASSTLGPPIT